MSPPRKAIIHYIHYIANLGLLVYGGFTQLSGDQLIPDLGDRCHEPIAASRLWEAQREAARSQMEELGEQVEAYERLNAGRGKGVVLEGVEDLPKALIRARIAAGMTQESLARRLGVKPQQVQRYEATEYGSASFARILKVVQALELSMPKAVRLVRNP